MRQPPFATSAAQEGALRDVAAFAAALGEKRRLIDAYDQQLVNILAARTKIVEEVAELKQQQRLAVFMKPAREAAIVRTMLAANAGALPPRLIVQLWREIMMASLQLEKAFSVAAVLPASGDMGSWQLARDHFGCVTPLVAVADVAGALAAVEAGTALLAVLPDPLADWWQQLVAREMPVRLVFRLPFLGGALQDANGAGKGAWAVGRVPSEPSGDDWTFLLFNTKYDISHVQDKLGLPVLQQWPGQGGALYAVQGALMPDDARLAQLTGVQHLGVVAVPVAGV